MSSGGELRALRRARRMTQAALAAACGVDLKAYRRWERGLSAPPPEALAALAAFFGCAPEDLRAGDGTETGEGYGSTQPSQVSLSPRRSPPPPGALKVLDLFCGAGGFSTGLEMTGAFAVTAGVDLLPDRVRTFAANHAHAHALCGDLRALPVEALIEHALEPDLVVGGPPCQGFSSLRPYRRLTEDDPRNNLLESFLLVVAKARPRWFAMENVVGLLQHKRRSLFEAALIGFTEIGYRVDWRVLNAASYGLPQRRERVIVVGSRDGRAMRWPTPTHRIEQASMAGPWASAVEQAPPEAPPARAALSAISDLPPLAAGESADAYLGPPQNAYQARLREGSPSLTLHQATRHSPRMLEIIRQSGASRGALPEGLVTSGYSSSYSRLSADEPAVTLTVNFVHPSSNKCIHPTQDRALTPREGARLQGFPDRFRFVGARSKVVKQIGNAVPPLLGELIGRALLDSMA